jgi:deoxyribodipyrimidine photo-lyase
MFGIKEERITELNGKSEVPGDFVLYWMQGALRTEDNYALEVAVERAKILHLPVVVFFCLMDQYPSASKAQYRFLLTALEEIRGELRQKKILLALARGTPEELLPKLFYRSALVVLDTGYLRHQRRWISWVTQHSPCRAVRVEGTVVVPPRIASSKEEWSAYTLRRKIQNLAEYFLDTPPEEMPTKSSLSLELPPEFYSDIQGLLHTIPGIAVRRMGEQRFTEPPGRKASLRRFEDFLNRTLERYHELKNDPNEDGTSRISGALHFGFLGPTEIIRRVLAAVESPNLLACTHPGAKAFIEELLVRRELAINMVQYRSDYDQFTCLPDWAQKTLAQAVLDSRETDYSEDDLEFGRTADPYWNAAQDQMVLTGYMHGYMRMYWGKRLLAWTPSPEGAYKIALRLNDSYSLDGRDPNGYAGVAWCFGKHDRPWTGRPIYGTIRFMNAQGLRRKFDADRYVQKIKTLKEERCSTILNTPK